MRRDPRSIICLAGLLLLANAAPGADAPDAAAAPAPRRVTGETRGDPRALAALQKPGKIFFEDDFESDASLSSGYIGPKGKAEQASSATGKPVESGK